MSKAFLGTATKYGAILFLAAVFAACSRTPKGIIPEKKMQKVLVDMQLAEAMINADPATYREQADKRALYQAVFDKHRLTAAAYDSSMVWYGKHLEQYLRIYDLALADIKHQISDIGDIKPDAASVSNVDSLDIWIFRKYYEFAPRSLSNRVIFDFHPEEAYSSGSVFVFGFQVWGITPSMSAPLEVRLSAFQGDTTLFAGNTLAKDGYHEIILKTLPTKKIQRVHGYIRLNTPDTTFHKLYLDDFSLMKYRYGSPAVTAPDSATLHND
jgi:hypothetical protein